MLDSIGSVSFPFGYYLLEWVDLALYGWDDVDRIYVEYETNGG